jgi:Raf kinase inhibitor-like YbhB/YbcL family protein
MTRSGAIAIGALLVTTATACGGSTSKGTHALDATDVPAKIVVSSRAFPDNGAIPRANTCDGAGTVPTISWTAVPAGTKSVAVVVDDPDAPSGDFLHWLVIGLSPTAGSVPNRAAGVSELDNTGGAKGWTPPCPPAGSTHHYQFSVYALRDYVCADPGDASNGPTCSPPASARALAQIKDAAIARGVLVGTYRR